MNVRVKICGITRLEDALLSIDAGASSLGFVFYEPSPRYVSPEVASEIIRQLPPFVTTTALFVNEEVSRIDEIIRLTKVDLLQFHGDESAVFCEQFNRPYIKALRMQPGLDLVNASVNYQSSRALLLDAYKPGVPGGTGEVFNWDLIPEKFRRDIILAGGLEADNIFAAITNIKPYAVDVSGGVEAEKGIKSPDKIKRFFEEVARANN